MKLKKFSADGFRNLREIELSFHPELNILCGRNAQGKTNILEAIWLCSGERSFRGAKDKELIGRDAEGYSLSLSFEDKRRTQQITCAVRRQELRSKKITLNGVNLRSASGLFGALECVIFTPEDLELSKGSPDIRRSFADLSVSQLKTSYRAVIDKYRRILEQRNLQLKLIASGKSDKSMLDIWDTQLSQMGAYISVLRYNYCKKLQKTAAALYSEISSGSERLTIDYHSTVYSELEGRVDYKNDLADEYFERLKNSRADDIRAGFTLHGIHRDDLRCSINGLYMKDYASQGQHRSAALIMKLSQAYILTEETGDPPCILLDDVMSELDLGRRSFIMNKIGGMQVMITCCDEELVKQYSGRLFRIESGHVTEG
ncbi:DNA replication and repair protein RecF [Ruminococcus sp. YE71]|uniref:DNA replication/repair protein RecF n=1 Tax=unclassified Ruminococcus TaxID=2608920 RepID=UPI0008885CFA|nr:MULTISPECIES: DNA replication/repair protein RecF [unclassified Ruminococcus]SDA31581.1 DNA replication and repair protein RecF [Ruminococcus sp. YE78]SFW52224.1 DNA replication and repair protein RecF [Ruminococcus sp. YE71]